MVFTILVSNHQLLRCLMSLIGMSGDGPGDLCRKLYILYILLTCNAHIMDFKTR